MTTKTAGITSDFFIYDMSNSEGWAWTLVQTDREILDEKLQAFRDAVMEYNNWVPERFSIHRYVDEEEFQKELEHWRKPESRFASMDINSFVHSSFGSNENEQIFEGIRWRRILWSSSI